MGFRHSTALNKLLVDFFIKICKRNPILQPTELSSLAHKGSYFDLTQKFCAVINYPSVQTWEDLSNQVYLLIKREAFCSFKLHDIGLAVDDPQKVPKNKAQTQKKRDKQKGDLFLCEDDFFLIKDFGKGPIINESVGYYEKWLEEPAKYKKQLLSNRRMKFRITSWLACQIIKRAALEYSVRIEAEHIDKDIFKKEFPEVKLPKELEGEDTIRIISVLDHKERTQKIKMKVSGTCLTGEGEFLCFRFANKVGEQDTKWKMVIHSTDSDCVPLALLNFHDFISPVSRDFIHEIYVYDDRRIWNMNTIFEGIWDYFIDRRNSEKFKIRAPIHVLCWLMIMDGNDYVEGIFGCSIEKVWNFFFEEGGHKYWNWEFSSKQKPPFNIDLSFGKRDAKSPITIDNDNCAIPFIKAMLGEKKQVDDEVLESYCMRIVWTMGYMMNSSKTSIFKPADSLSFGWYYDKEEGIYKRKNEIVSGTIKSIKKKASSSRNGVKKSKIEIE